MDFTGDNMKLKSLLLRGLSFAAISFVFPHVATAQVSPAPIPPVSSSIDDNGVDLINRTRRSRGPVASIGEDGLEVGFSDYLSKDDLIWTLNSSGNQFIVSLGSKSEIFKSASGVITSEYQNGGTLKVGTSPNTYVYTSPDGDVIVFDSTLVPTFNSPVFGFQANLGVAVSMTKPDGEVVSFHWDKTTTTMPPREPGLPPTSYTSVLLKSVFSSKGYAIVVSGWARKAVNLAVDYCDLQAGTCPNATKNWPGFSSNGSTAPVEITASDDRKITYNGLGDANAKTTTFANGQSETFQLSGNTATFTNGVGTWNYNWSTSGSTVTVYITDPIGRVQSATYNATQKKILTRTNALGQVTSFQYDNFSRLTRVTEPEGNYIQYIYDDRGNITSRRSVAKPGSGLADLVVFYNYDTICANPKKCNKPNSFTNEAGKVTNYTYDINGLLKSVTLPPPSNGAIRPEVRYDYVPVSTYMKNASGSLFQAGSIWRLSKISTCRTLSSCTNTSDELVTEYSYANSLHADPTSIKKSSGDGTLTATTILDYDAVGNLAFVDGPLPGDGDSITYFYDDMRRRKGSITGDPDGAGALSRSAQRITYDNVGRPAKVETGLASGSSEGALAAMTVVAKAEVTYDVVGRVSARQQTVIAPNNPGGRVVGVTQLSYDNADQLTCSAIRLKPDSYGSLPSSACELTLPAGSDVDRITSYTYDNLGRITNARMASGTGVFSDTSSTYSANGHLQTLTDARGNKTTFVYDGFDRQVQVMYPVSNDGGLSSTSDFDGITYDASGRAVARRRRDGQSYTLIYDDLNRVASTSLGDVVNYNNLGQMTSVSRGGKVVSWTFDGFGRSVAENSNGLIIGLDYDVSNKIKRMTWPDGFYVTYEYNDGGMPTSIRENGSNALVSYTYDDYGLSAMSRGNGTTTSYERDTALMLKKLTNDVSGTIFDNSITFTYTESSQIKTRELSNSRYALPFKPSTTNYSYNSLNQMIAGGASSIEYDGRGNLSSDGTLTYIYDIENRLTGLSMGSSLSYDPVGRLSQVTSVGGTVTRFLYSGSSIVGEYDANNVILNRYVHGIGIDDPVVWYDTPATSEKKYLLKDERGSVVSITDSSGSVIGINSYDEFGIPSPSNMGRFQYTGQAWIPEVGLYYYKTRFYSPTIGRFLQPDPEIYKDGMNLYNYVGNDPINLKDPTGTYSAPTLLPGGLEEKIRTVTVKAHRCGRDRLCFSGQNVIIKGIVAIAIKTDKYGKDHYWVTYNEVVRSNEDDEHDRQCDLAKQNSAKTEGDLKSWDRELSSRYNSRAVMAYELRVAQANANIGRDMQMGLSGHPWYQRVVGAGLMTIPGLGVWFSEVSFMGDAQQDFSEARERAYSNRLLALDICGGN